MLTILILPADPSAATRQRATQEMQEIEEKLTMFGLHDELEFRQRGAASAEELARVLREEQPQVVHFAAARPGPGALSVADPAGAAVPIAPDDLAALFEPLAGQVQGVVLNGCYAEDQARALARHVPCVVGLAAAMAPITAKTFNLGFYQSLDRGMAMLDAFQFGIVQIGLQRIYDNVKPVLVRK